MHFLSHVILQSHLKNSYSFIYPACLRCLQSIAERYIPLASISLPQDAAVLYERGEIIMASNNQGNKQSSGTKNRGFASMDPERQRQIASEGGKAAHQKGTAHEFTSEEARRAGSMSHGNRQSANASGAASTSTSRSTSKGNKQ
jgi:general stress protein YciG